LIELRFFHSKIPGRLMRPGFLFWQSQHDAIRADGLKFDRHRASRAYRRQGASEVRGFNKTGTQAGFAGLGRVKSAINSQKA